MRSICLVGLMPFPDGGAATSRLRSFAAGLVAAGWRVHVLAYGGEPGAAAPTPEEKSEWGGAVLWRYYPRVNGRPGRWRLRRIRWQEDDAIVRRVRLLLAAKEAGAIFLYTQEPGIALRLIRVAREFRVSFVQQYAELQVLKDAGQGVPWPNLLRQQIHIRLVPRRAAGNVVISRLLEERCARSGAAPIIRVPALTGTDRRPLVRMPVDMPFSFTYLGAGARRDCLDALIQGFSLLWNRQPEVRLNLVGLQKSAVLQVRAQLAGMGLGALVCVRSWMSSSDVEFIRIWRDTHAFVLLRSDDQSARACFPTRLPEFLLAQRPVILSRVGDVPDTLRDRQEAVFVASNSPADVAEALGYLAALPSRAASIGEAGGRAAEREFSHLLWGQRLSTFLETLRPAGEQ